MEQKSVKLKRQKAQTETFLKIGFVCSLKCCRKDCQRRANWLELNAKLFLCSIYFILLLSNKKFYFVSIEISRSKFVQRQKQRPLYVHNNPNVGQVHNIVRYHKGLFHFDGKSCLLRMKWKRGEKRERKIKLRFEYIFYETWLRIMLINFHREFSKKFTSSWNFFGFTHIYSEIKDH